MTFYASPRMHYNRMPSPTRSIIAEPYRSHPSHATVMATDNTFHVQRSPRLNGRRPQSPALRSAYNDTEETGYQEGVKKLLIMKNAPFAVHGRIPLDPAHLVLFFRSKTGITHSLDFPIDVDFNTPPALEVLVATCRPHQDSGSPIYPSGLGDGDLEGQSLFYPSNLPLTTSLELANHPVLDAVRSTLFPTLAVGHYLVAVRDKLEIRTQGEQLDASAGRYAAFGIGGGQYGSPGHILPKANDGRVATIYVTLPVRYRGGALIVHHPLSGEDTSGTASDKFSTGGGNDDGLEWVAFLAECDHSVETVLQGCRVAISYAVFTKTFGHSGTQPNPLIVPSDNLQDTLAPVLNMYRGQKIAFYLSGEYSVNPGEALADSIVPILTGGDSLLYHALKKANVSPELHWTAGGYIWPLDRSVEIQAEAAHHPSNTNDFPLPLGILKNGPRFNANSAVPPVRGAFSSPGYENYNPEHVPGDVDNLSERVVDSGAMLLADAQITVLTDDFGAIVGKERVAFVSAGELDRLVVNVLMVVYVP